MTCFLDHQPFLVHFVNHHLRMTQDKHQDHTPKLQGADFWLFRDLAPPMEDSYGIMVLVRRWVYDVLAQEQSILVSRKANATSRRPTWMSKELIKLKHKKESQEMWTLPEHVETGLGMSELT